MFLPVSGAICIGLAALMSLGEMWYEKTLWPQATWKGSLCLIVLGLLGLSFL